jgi:hypothetical protein
MVSRSICNLKIDTIIDTIYMYDITFDRSFLQLSNSIRQVMPSTDTKPELTAKPSMAQPVSQTAVYANGLSVLKTINFCGYISEALLWCCVVTVEKILKILAIKKLNYCKI